MKISRHSAEKLYKEQDSGKMVKRGSEMSLEKLKNELKTMLLESGAVMTRTFLLSSGKSSSFYINIKKASTNPRILKTIARGMAELVEGEDRIAGMALGAVPLATAVALETMKPFVMIRKEQKGHGTKNRIEGELREGENVIIIEDVATTGGSMKRAVEEVRNAGGTVKRALVVVDREEGAEELLKSENVELISLLRISEILGAT